MFMHCGQMLHGGSAVTKGVRYILVAFVEIMNPPVADQLSLQETDEASDEDDDDDDDDMREGEVGGLGDEEDPAHLAVERTGKKVDEAAKDRAKLETLWGIIVAAV